MIINIISWKIIFIFNKPKYLNYITNWENLKNVFSKMTGKYVLAFSGGIDSRFLAFAAKNSGVDFIACTLDGPHLTSFELERAAKWCASREIDHSFLEFDPLRIEDIRENNKKRCYFCKKEMLRRLKSFSRPLMDGSNADDFASDRPGIRALQEAGVLSPLMQAGLDKKGVRSLAESFGLEYPGQPSRSCLLTRLGKDAEMKRETLSAVRYCEQAFFSAGLKDFRVCVYPQKVFVVISEKERDVFLPRKQEFLGVVENKLQSEVELIITERVSGTMERLKNKI